MRIRTTNVRRCEEGSPAKGCKHYNGWYHNDTCLAGVCYRDVTPRSDEPGCAIRKPCQPIDTPHAKKVIAEDGPQGTCDKYEEHTAGERDEIMAELNKHADMLRLTLPIVRRVKDEHKGHEWQGVVECPVCKGKLHLSHAAYNGHVWGRCETEGCVSWME